MMSEKITAFKTEEEKKIYELPVKKVKYFGETVKCHMDEEKGIIYYLDQNGKLNGKTAIISKRNIAPLPKNTEESLKNEGSKVDRNDITIKDETKEQKTNVNSLKNKIANIKISDIKKAVSVKDNTPEEVNKKKLFYFVVCGIVLVFVLIACLSLVVNAFSSDDISPSKGNNNSSKISVVQVTDDLLPGDTITKYVIKEESISNQMYNEILQTGAQLYKWEDVNTLINKSVTAFIPNGKYLSYENVGSVYTQPLNPWCVESTGYQYITLPLTDTLVKGNNVNYGTVMDITIIRKTLSGVSYNNDSNFDSVSGLQHQTSSNQSYIVDKFELPSAVVCDILNSKEESLYSLYTTWMSVPVGMQAEYIKNEFLENPALKENVICHYITIKLSDEQLSTLGNLNSKDITIEYKPTQNIDANTNDKLSYAANARALREIIKEAMEIAEKESE